MAKLVSISLMDEVITADRLLEALNKLSSRDLRKYFKRKKMAFPRPIRYAFLTKCIKRDFQAVPKDLLAGESRVFTASPTVPLVATSATIKSTGICSAKR